MKRAVIGYVLKCRLKISKNMVFKMFLGQDEILLDALCREITGLRTNLLL